MAKFAQVCPTIYGNGAIAQVGEEVKKLGCKKVLVVSEKFVSGTDFYKTATKSLTDAGIKYVEFLEVLPDPPDTIVDKAGAFAKAEKIDGIVAIGGGSTIDTAKSANLLINNPGKILDYPMTMDYKPGVPLVAIPTTSGTGSESTIFSVVTNTVTHQKNVMLGTAVLGILDPTVTLGCPPALTAATGMDAFSHSAEGITSIAQNAHSIAMGTDAIRKIVKYLPIAVMDGSNLEARENLMLASNFAGICFNDSIVHLGHAVAHSIGASHHVPHGLSCALALPEVMRYSAEFMPAQVQIVGEAMGLRFNYNETPKQIGDYVGWAIRSFNRSVGIPSLKELNIPRDQVVGLADMVMSDATYQFLPKKIDKKEIATSLAAMYDNY